jgi:hypothetical protein
MAKSTDSARHDGDNASVPSDGGDRNRRRRDRRRRGDRGERAEPAKQGDLGAVEQPDREASATPIPASRANAALVAPVNEPVHDTPVHQPEAARTQSAESAPEHPIKTAAAAQAGIADAIPASPSVRMNAEVAPVTPPASRQSPLRDETPRSPPPTPPVQAADLPSVTLSLPPDSSLVLVETRHHAPLPEAEPEAQSGPRRTRRPRVQLADEPLQIVETRKDQPPAN